ncbi:hypothetical protein [Vibrio scophthalmi]|uniref:Uncharacterized protein n=1 Tax=Vibrio scophthalmi TaxID=45658 RepID=A0A1E3WIY5_9VIBR|nr:hypothetical protein [Vibrio scophthalmi]ODS09744.1 hypothetical protein VSF3289_03206 [Vibrio scophthalmi]
MNKIFIELQRASGLSNSACGHYLGLSEGAVRDRRRGVFEPKRSELIALAIVGSSAESMAKKIISSHCDHFFNAEGVCRVCRLDTEKPEPLNCTDCN